MRPSAVRAVLAGLLALAATSVGAQSWSDAQEAEIKGLFRGQGFFVVLQNVVRGSAPPSELRPWVDRLGEPSLLGTTVRDTLVALPPSADSWVLPLVRSLPADPERDWVLDRRQAAGPQTGKFHLSLYPVRMDLLAGVSMVLPNYDWSISYQDPGQMTVQALEKGYSATLHVRWIDPKGLDVFDTARLVQMYAGFRPRYIVTKPTGDSPGESDLVPLPPVEPQALLGQPGVLEQVQVGAPGAWQLYVGRTRWYQARGKVLVVLLSVHIERDQKWADRDRVQAKVGQLLDTLRIEEASH